MLPASAGLAGTGLPGEPVIGDWLTRQANPGNKMHAPLATVRRWPTGDGKEGMTAERQILSQEDIRRALNRVAHEILERNRGAQDLVVVGIYTRGRAPGQPAGGKYRQVRGEYGPRGRP